MPTNAPPGVGLGGAVQQAKRKGLSLRAIARELGVSRVTVAKYARANRPPLNRFGMGDAGANGALLERDRSRPLTFSLRQLD